MVGNRQRQLRVGLCAFAGLMIALPVNYDVSRAHGAKGSPAAFARKTIRMKKKVAPAAEWMTYGVYFGPLRVGRAKLAIGRPGGDARARAFHIRGRAEALTGIPGWTGYAEEQTTTVDAARLLPLRSTLHTYKSGKDKTTVTQHRSLKPGITRQTIKRAGQKHASRRVHRLPAGHFDLLSAIAALREMRLAKGQRQQITVLMGTKIYRVDLTGVGSEKIIVSGQRQVGQRIDGVARRTTDRGNPLRNKKPTRLSVWLSGDKRRVPLRLSISTKIGAVRMQLDGYRAPAKLARLRR